MVATWTPTANLIGGSDGTPLEREDENGTFGRLYASIEVFDFAAERVVPSTLRIDGPMRRAFTATCDTSRIVVASGLGPATLNGPEGSKYDWVQSFTPGNPQPWSYLPMLSMNLFSPGIFDVAGTLVVVGGSRYDRRPNPDVLILKPGANNWVVNSSRPSKAGTFLELVPLANREVLVLGGHSGSRADPNPLGLCEVLTIN